MEITTCILIASVTIMICATIIICQIIELRNSKKYKEKCELYEEYRTKFYYTRNTLEKFCSIIERFSIICTAEEIKEIQNIKNEVAKQHRITHN